MGDGLLREYLWLSPQMAEKLGQALYQASKYYKKMKDFHKDATEVVEIEDVTVSFLTSMKYDFSVWLKEKMGGGYLSLIIKQPRN